MGDRRFPRHARGAAEAIAYMASASPSSCGYYFWGELRKFPLHALG
jgi:hypothetical protein